MAEAHGIGKDEAENKGLHLLLLNVEYEKVRRLALELNKVLS